MSPNEGSRSGDSDAQISEEIDLPTKRIRTKACQRCQRTDDTLYRVRVDESRTWIFVCSACLEIVKPGNPLYQSGGTWKSKKRH
ncbi:MAG: hypothetical protein ACK6DC_17770 [Planctomycetota bacterium]